MWRRLASKSGAPSLLVFLCCFIVYLAAGFKLENSGIYDRGGNDHFFRSDTRRAFIDIAGDRETKHWHTSAHPNFVIFHQPLAAGLQCLIKAFKHKLPKDAVMRRASIIITSAGGAAAAAMFCQLLLLRGLPRTRALLFTAVLAASTSHLFFASVPETYIFSALGIIVIMWLALRDGTKEGWWQLAALYTWSVLTSNLVTIGIWALIRHRAAGLRGMVLRVTTSLAITACALLLLNGLQWRVYPQSDLFFASKHDTQSNWLYWEHLHQPMHHAKVLLQHLGLSNIVAPDPVSAAAPVETGETPHAMASIEAGTWAQFAPAWPLHGLWLLIVLGAVVSLCRPQTWNIALLGCATVLAFNFVFFFIFGHDRMLYSALWTSSSVLLIALAWEPMAKRYARIFAIGLAVFVVCQLWHNWAFLDKIMAITAAGLP